MSRRSHGTELVGIAAALTTTAGLLYALGSTLDLGALKFAGLMTMASTFVPMPADSYVLGAAASMPALTIALVAGAVNAVAVLVERQFLLRIVDLAFFDRLRTFIGSNRFVTKAHDHMFVGLVLGAATPLPFEAFRLVAVTRRYSPWRYASATFIGRSARFYALASAGSMLAAHDLLPIVLVATLALFAVGLAQSVRRWGRPAASTCSSGTQIKARKTTARPAPHSTPARTSLAWCRRKKTRFAHIATPSTRIAGHQGVMANVATATNPAALEWPLGKLDVEGFCSPVVHAPSTGRSGRGRRATDFTGPLVITHSASTPTASCAQNVRRPDDTAKPSPHIASHTALVTPMFASSTIARVAAREVRGRANARSMAASNRTTASAMAVHSTASTAMAAAAQQTGSGELEHRQKLPTDARWSRDSSQNPLTSYSSLCE